MGKSLPIKKHAKNNPIISDLTSHRWRGPILTQAEELELVRRAQVGGTDAANAKRTLLEKFHRQILAIADRYYGPEREERLSAGYAGFLKAVRAFDPVRGFRLATVVGKYVATDIGTFVRSHYRRWRLHEPEASFVSLESLKPGAAERSDKDGKRWETWEPRRVGYKRPRDRVTWWWRPPPHWPVTLWAAGFGLIPAAWARRPRSRVVVTPMRVMEPVQRVLKQIGKLYRQTCDAPWRGAFEARSNPVLLGGVEFKKLPEASTPAVRTLPTTDVKKKACFRQQPCEFCDPKAHALTVLECNIIDTRKPDGRVADAPLRDALRSLVGRRVRPAARKRQRDAA